MLDFSTRARLSVADRSSRRILSDLSTLAVNGAGDGNRTRASSLEGYSSTIELLPRRAELVACVAGLVEGGGFEPPKA